MLTVYTYLLRERDAGSIREISQFHVSLSLSCLPFGVKSITGEEVQMQEMLVEMERKQFHTCYP